MCTRYRRLRDRLLFVLFARVERLIYGDIEIGDRPFKLAFGELGDAAFDVRDCRGRPGDQRLRHALASKSQQRVERKMMKGAGMRLVFIVFSKDRIEGGRANCQSALLPHADLLTARSARSQ
jgi:hypothetical protein